MSFIGEGKGTTYAPGYFLASADCDRKTEQVTQSMATTESDGTKHVKAGTPFPANNSTATGLVYEDVDVTTGTMPASIVKSGVVFSSVFPVVLKSSAISALEAAGIKFVSGSSVTRPY